MTSSNRARRRRVRIVAAVVAAAAMVLTGCGSSASSDDAIVTMTVNAPAAGAETGSVQIPGLVGSSSAPAVGAVPTANVNQARYTLKPRTDTVDVPPNDPVNVTVFAANLDEVRLVADDGTEIAGEINEAKSTWTSTERLEYNTHYTYEGSATAKESSEALAITGGFTTVQPTDLMGIQVNIPDGATVGIAAPMIVTFAKPVTNRAAVERAMTVTSSLGDEIEGNWAWVQDEDFQGVGVQSQVHWRPTKSPFAGATPYWPAGTDVKVDLDFKGVPFGDGNWGKSDLTTSFKIRPEAQIVKADVSSFHMVVEVNGQTVKNYPVSYGAETGEGRATTNGIHIVTNKYPEFSMCNREWGYCNSKQKWAVRINNNGEFIHQNLESKASHGKANVSHGCVNMGEPDAEEYYNSAMYGDPVEIVNAAGGQMTEKDALYDWIYAPDAWKQLSALG